MIAIAPAAAAASQPVDAAGAAAPAQPFDEAAAAARVSALARAGTSGDTAAALGSLVATAEWRASTVPGATPGLARLRVNAAAARAQSVIWSQTRPGALLRSAEAALRSRTEFDGPDTARSRRHALANVAAARAIAAATDPFEAAIAATEAQARAAGGGRALDALTPNATPAAAVSALLERHGATLSAAQREAVAGLDRLAAPAAGALAAFVDAYVEFERNARAVAGRSDIEGLAPVLHARAGLLRATRSLSLALGAGEGANLTPVRVPPFVSIDLADEPTSYPDDFHLIVDAGGNDVYTNNAGGSAFAGCSVRGAAALLDLGGADRYEGARTCGANGGGIAGAGFLVDRGSGADTYVAGAQGTNGGGFFGGAGFLLDEGGDDVYTATDWGVNGGALQGAGLLLDVAGADRYTGGSIGINGGGANGALGMLVDRAGADRYVGKDGGVNGGASNTADRPQGFGFLLDEGGADRYEARTIGVNGGAGGYQEGAVGFLLDRGGDDTYIATDGGVNGGGWTSLGMLLDEAGGDTYTAGQIGTNGGGRTGQGFLIDGGNGADTYVATRSGTNGGATTIGSPIPGQGFLVDAGGANTFTATDNGTNGGAYGGFGILPTGYGFLLALGEGNDRYTGGETGTNGGAIAGDGFLLDESGDDRYFGKQSGVNGGGGAFGLAGGSVNVLLDVAGNDDYTVGEWILLVFHPRGIGVNGGAFGSNSMSFLLDAAGNDAYLSGESATNGGGRDNGAGNLVDAAGVDRYTAGGFGTNGGAAGGLGIGMLLDGGGTGDLYQDQNGGNGTDKTVFLKGGLGWQLDVAR